MHQAPAAAASADVAVVASSRSSGGPQLAGRVGQQRAQEALAAGGDQHRVAELVQPLRAGRARPSSGRRSWRSRCPGRPRSAPGATPAASAASSRSRSSVDHVGDHVAVAGVLLHLARSAPASASARRRRPSGATVGSISSSASPPETSLTSTAPASTAASATAARIVSTETHDAVGGQRASRPAAPGRAPPAALGPPAPRAGSTRRPRRRGRRRRRPAGGRARPPAPGRGSGRRRRTSPGSR